MRLVGRALLLLVLLGSTEAQQGVVPFSAVKDLAQQWARYYAEVYRVPRELVEAIIEEESGWNPYAVSNKGAVGLMQLMPKTAVRFGVRNRFRLEQNIQGGVAYLAWLKQEFQGDLRLVTAAYYVGESRIHLRALEYSNPDVHGYVDRVAKRYRAKRAHKAVNSAEDSQGEVSREQHP